MRDKIHLQYTGLHKQTFNLSGRCPFLSSSIIKVNTLGNLSISSDNASIDYGSGRSRKPWQLMVYLLLNKGRTVSPDEITSHLWSAESAADNPGGALKTTLYRARQILSPLADDVGCELVLRTPDGLRWNPDVKTETDAEEFSSLCQAAAASSDDNEKLDLLSLAATLYQGDFLGKLSSESWAVSTSAYYHNMYVNMASETIDLMTKAGLKDEAQQLCRNAIQLEPYHESFYSKLMMLLAEKGDSTGVVKLFEDLRELLFSNFGVLPSDETQAIYRQAMKTVNDKALPAGTIRQQLREQAPQTGALICDYDFFRVLYHAEARMIDRRGDAIHLGLLSVSAKDGSQLAPAVHDKAMDRLQDQIRQSLRRGDVAARCSASQYIMMLHQANYENSCMVCERVLKAFYRSSPSTAASVSYSVFPLEPFGTGGNADPLDLAQ